MQFRKQKTQIENNRMQRQSEYLLFILNFSQLFWPNERSLRRYVLNDSLIFPKASWNGTFVRGLLLLVFNCPRRSQFAAINRSCVANYSDPKINKTIEIDANDEIQRCGYGLTREDSTKNTKMIFWFER